MISSNLIKVRAGIESACRKSGRDPRAVRIVCVTKGIPAERIQDVLKLGITDIGENRIQEALLKFRVIGGNATWHMVGHLQSNKVPDALKIFSLIHSVDSVHLAEKIDRSARKLNKVQDVLIQVNISGEDSKFGVPLPHAAGFISELSSFSGIKVRGLMGMAKQCDDPEETRPSFRALNEVFTELRRQSIGHADIQYLSMGMSQDYEIAIEEGANLLRIGTAIFQGCE